jgi:multiple sugar transport system ATP-binding protein
MATVVFDHVSKRFDEVTALDDFVLEIEDSEFLVLVGPSGCGKSTALRCLAGLERVTSGRILIGDRDVTYQLPKQRDVAMVFQNYALYPHMTVAENMGFGLKLRKRAKDEIAARVGSAAEMLGLADLLERKPRQLSGGQRQRVALGRAIVRHPQAFLMDEPLSNLDAQLRVQMRAEIIELQRRLGATMVYVTHDQVEAMTMGHRIAIMRGGVLQQLGSTEEVYERPANLFVATFIGSPAMNIVRAEAVGGGDGGGFELRAKGIWLRLPAEQARRLAAKAPRDLLVGIRPEHLELPQGGAGDEAGRVELPVRLVEPLGAENLVHLEGPEGRDVVARLGPDVRPREGEKLPLAVRTRHIYVFDRETEASLA